MQCTDFQILHCKNILLQLKVLHWKNTLLQLKVLHSKTFLSKNIVNKLCLKYQKWKYLFCSKLFPVKVLGCFGINVTVTLMCMYFLLLTVVYSNLQQCIIFCENHILVVWLSCVVSMSTHKKKRFKSDLKSLCKSLFSLINTFSNFLNLFKLIWKMKIQGHHRDAIYFITNTVLLKYLEFAP